MLRYLCSPGGKGTPEGDDVDRAVHQRLEILAQRVENAKSVEAARIAGQVDQKVDIPGAAVPPSHRAEHSHVGDLVSGGEAKNLRAFGPQLVQARSVAMRLVHAHSLPC